MDNRNNDYQRSNWQKVVVHVNAGGAVTPHRGVLESADAHFIKLKNDSGVFFYSMSNLVGIQMVYA